MDVEDIADADGMVYLDGEGLVSAAGGEAQRKKEERREKAMAKAHRESSRYTSGVCHA